jgi:hypothetical protein
MDSMSEGVLPMSPSTFSHMLRKELQPAALVTPPSHRRVRQQNKCGDSVLEQPFSKEAVNIPSTVAAARNVLLRKLVLSKGSEVETEEFNCCLQLFKDGLIEEQA